jgi:hypothetical protein
MTAPARRCRPSGSAGALLSFRRTPAGPQEMRDRIDDPALDVAPDSVLVLAGCGPVGAAMPRPARSGSPSR